MTDIREQEMQNRIDALVLEKENLSNEVSYLKEQVAYLKELAFGSRTGMESHWYCTSPGNPGQLGYKGRTGLAYAAGRPYAPAASPPANHTCR